MPNRMPKAGIRGELRGREVQAHQQVTDLAHPPGGFESLPFHQNSLVFSAGYALQPWAAGNRLPNPSSPRHRTSGATSCRALGLRGLESAIILGDSGGANGERIAQSAQGHLSGSLPREWLRCPFRQRLPSTPRTPTTARRESVTVLLGDQQRVAADHQIPAHRNMARHVRLAITNGEPAE